jgi:hypothetical protein
MSRRVASVIAVIGVLKTGSATLLNSLLRLRGGIRARQPHESCALLYVDSLFCGLYEWLHLRLLEHLGSGCRLKSDPRFRLDRGG